MKKTESPLLSIIIPVYNTSLYLQQAVESVISNASVSFEIILVDDASNDGITEGVYDKMQDLLSGHLY